MERNKKRRSRRLAAGILLSTAGIGLAAILLLYTHPSYIYIPDREHVLNPRRPAATVRTAQTPENPEPTDEETLDLGRRAFYGETFGNEHFLMDIMGLLDGPLTIRGILKATAALKGEGTTNLRVAAEKDAVIGGRTIRKGDLIDTGLDVAKGSYVPLGLKVSLDKGKPRVGVGCIACHAVYDPVSGKVVEGPPNTDLNVGLLLAMGNNSAAFFTHTGVTTEQIRGLIRFKEQAKSWVTDSEGKRTPLPDPDELERLVDEQLMKWPPGSIDTTIDMENNPVQIPDSFTLGDHPYNWNGTAFAGPFKGLMTFSGVPNAQNMDALAQAGLSKPIFGLDKEVYMGILLQRAASSKYRYDPAKGTKPSEQFAAVDPTPDSPGIIQSVPSPAHPRSSFVSVSGVLSSVPGYPINRHTLAMSAYQNTLKPPRSHLKRDARLAAEGEAVFRRAGCITCHAGPYLTNNRIVATDVLGTNPSRARSFKKTEKFWGPPLMYDYDTPVPLPKKPKLHRMPLNGMSEEQIRLAFAHGNSPGGYKTPSLYGLYWSAPYLHDGGVAAGPEPGQYGIPGTFKAGILPDPAESLRALVDKRLRERVVKANQADKDLREANVEGIGHNYWVDETTGFTRREQDALIHYLLTLHDKDE
ncbi:hypothetical protein Theco_0561 [Thermobacillus composti KWC4]|uniref:Cytochrome c domain-containing protein n=1 Tax=Thermobacillus composti (strain DSM 18247 / JCM 13945 / KWC4) TaxID=717605 RepID=L0EAP5_THECK|nr:hypothetical protein [Thermobacillus composti]AGA56771.1 hypothetical protein Theco_0561 [Thermobacillus composti KWC4]